MVPAKQGISKASRGTVAGEFGREQTVGEKKKPGHNSGLITHNALEN